MGVQRTWVSTASCNYSGNIFTEEKLRHSGNVSYEVPGFHAMYIIPANGVNHTQDFTSGAGSSEAFERTIACASGIAAVACKILVDDYFAEQVERDFRMGLEIAVK